MIKTQLREFRELQLLLSRSRKLSGQMNSLFSSDSELIRLSKKSFLSLSTDGLAEEYEEQLYTDPETLGWISVVMSLSDVACSGGTPIGVLQAVNWAKEMSLPFKKKFFKGVQACLKHHGAYLLGGDTGVSRQFSVATTAVAKGVGQPLQRLPLKVGDIVVSLSPLGLHSAYAYDFLMKTRFFNQSVLRPTVPIHMISQAKSFFRASIDNSDGIMSTLNILSDLNRVSFDIHFSQITYHPRARKFCRQQNIPVSSLLWAELGGYELIAVVKKHKRKEFEKKFPTLKPFADVTEYDEEKQKIFIDLSKEKTYFKRMQKAINNSSL